jgi:hypothetical protein
VPATAPASTTTGDHRLGRADARRTGGPAGSVRAHRLRQGRLAGRAAVVRHAGRRTRRRRPELEMSMGITVRPGSRSLSTPTASWSPASVPPRPPSRRVPRPRRHRRRPPPAHPRRLTASTEPRRAGLATDVNQTSTICISPGATMPSAPAPTRRRTERAQRPSPSEVVDGKADTGHSALRRAPA